jgi:hypothetical protein
MLYGVGTVSRVARRIIDEIGGISKPVKSERLEADLGRLMVIDVKLSRGVVKVQAVSSTKT